MLAEQFLTATASARNSTALDEIARFTWRAHGEGHVADAILSRSGAAGDCRPRFDFPGQDGLSNHTAVWAASAAFFAWERCQLMAASGALFFVVERRNK